jgi:hypothetical protein
MAHQYLSSLSGTLYIEFSSGLGEYQKELQQAARQSFSRHLA